MGSALAPASSFPSCSCLGIPQRTVIYKPNKLFPLQVGHGASLQPQKPRDASQAHSFMSRMGSVGLRLRTEEIGTAWTNKGGANRASRRIKAARPAVQAPQQQFSTCGSHDPFTIMHIRYLRYNS